MPSDVLTVELYVASPHARRARLDVAFEVPAGISVLSGPSGSGKSTCLAALAGLLQPTRGRIVLAGRTLLDSRRHVDVPTHARQIALVFQSLALFPHLTVAENVAFGLVARTSTVRSHAQEPRASTLRSRAQEPRASTRAWRDALVAHWLERMRIAHLARRRPTTLSGGEAQRVAIARALASSPALLLLDEPFSALDASLRHELSEEVQCLVAELCIPALLVSHQPDQRLPFGAKKIELRDGVVAATSVAEEVSEVRRCLSLGAARA
jgi:molybdate transport system ATP-binding protein